MVSRIGKVIQGRWSSALARREFGRRMRNVRRLAILYAVMLWAAPSFGQSQRQIVWERPEAAWYGSKLQGRRLWLHEELARCPNNRIELVRLDLAGRYTHGGDRMVNTAMFKNSEWMDAIVRYFPADARLGGVQRVSVNLSPSGIYPDIWIDDRMMRDGLADGLRAAGYRVCVSCAAGAIDIAGTLDMAFEYPPPGAKQFMADRARSLLGISTDLSPLQSPDPHALFTKEGARAELFRAEVANLATGLAGERLDAAPMRTVRPPLPMLSPEELGLLQRASARPRSVLGFGRLLEWLRAAVQRRRGL